jgi:hypothetical protein
VDVAEPIVSFINRDITRSEIVEADLDACISKRHEARVKEEGHRPSEEALGLDEFVEDWTSNLEKDLG